MLVKRVPDPERIRVDRKTGKLLTADIPYILNPVDLAALELALRLKEATGATVTAVSVDQPAAEFEMREALAMGADAALLIADPGLTSEDTLLQARVFELALRRIVAPEIVLAAARSIDHMWSTVGPQLAQLLDWPLVIEAESLALRGDHLEGTAHTGAARAHVRCGLPAVVTVARGVVKPRRPTSWGVAAAFDEKKVEVKALADLGLDPSTEKLLRSVTQVARVESQEVERERRRLEGDPADVGRILARRLADQGWAGRRP